MTTIDKIKPFLVTLKATPYTKMTELQEELGLSRSAVIAVAIEMLHEKKLNNYVTAMKQRQPREILSPEERADRDAQNKLALKDRERELAVERGLELAKMLDAKIEVQNNGSQFATWKVYAKETPRYVSVGEFGKTITDITELDVQSQFRGGTKEELFAILNAE